MDRKPWIEDEDGNRARFIKELEFVQCLCNPLYLQHLSVTGVMDDPAFVKYIEYLQYWKKPEYVKFIAYPFCLFFLESLRQAEFREKLSNIEFIETIRTQLDNFWAYYRFNRLKDGSSGTVNVKTEDNK